MTTKEAAERILDFIKHQGGGVSFAELQVLLGEEAKGDHWLGRDDLNIWFWFGMSALFVDALESLKTMIEPTPTNILVYYVDGCVPRLPLAKQNRRYKDPHWLPTTWNMRRAAKKRAA